MGDPEIVKILTWRPSFVMVAKPLSTLIPPTDLKRIESSIQPSQTLPHHNDGFGSP